MTEESSDRNTFIPKVTIDVAAERKRPRLESILFAEHASITEGGLYNLSGCFTRLLFDKNEKRITNKFYLYVQAGEAGSGEVQVAVFNPEDRLHWAMSVDVETAEYVPKYPVQLHLLQYIQFPVPIEGNYWFDVSYNGMSLGGTVLIVEFNSEEAGGDEK